MWINNFNINVIIFLFLLQESANKIAFSDNVINYKKQSEELLKIDACIEEQKLVEATIVHVEDDDINDDDPVIKDQHLTTFFLNTTNSISDNCAGVNSNDKNNNFNDIVTHLTKELGVDLESDCEQQQQQQEQQQVVVEEQDDDGDVLNPVDKILSPSSLTFHEDTTDGNIDTVIASCPTSNQVFLLLIARKLFTNGFI